jgi:hypothetical protein
MPLKYPSFFRELLNFNEAKAHFETFKTKHVVHLQVATRKKEHNKSPSYLQRTQKHLWNM